ncbi:hypothetical protein [Staphylococcus equorum]|uniref:hypothetical protein n=1 Tax=Staphylococcus equorum TaxID=246432 RepID=UPI003CEACCD7
MNEWTIGNVLKEQVADSMKRTFSDEEKILNHISFLLQEVDVKVTEENSMIVEYETKKYATYLIENKKLYVVMNSFDDEKATLTIYSKVKELRINSIINDKGYNTIESIELDNVKITRSKNNLNFEKFIKTALKTF